MGITTTQAPETTEASEFISTVEQLHPTPAWAQNVLITVWSLTGIVLAAYGAIAVVFWYRKRKNPKKDETNKTLQKDPPAKAPLSTPKKPTPKSGTKPTPKPDPKSTPKPDPKKEEKAEAKSKADVSNVKPDRKPDDKDLATHLEEPKPISISPSAFGSIDAAEALKETQQHLTSEQEQEVMKKEKPPANHAEFLKRAEEQYANLPPDARQGMRPAVLLLGYIKRKEAERLAAEKAATEAGKKAKTPADKNAATSKPTQAESSAKSSSKKPKSEDDLPEEQ
ncbi:unnamed protein product [Bursaphelenchus xylophilus]|uniref:(pine wood nematode) hypothetical protein n=1 Tax=Bursaphelenchus xylophilus TaxID=6326 RepID=A0A7I8XPX6_BURXY|nr:unnamed protein product [Bursaphelenchus xylophilus]CAG9126822.1 unnamed protein product [Bursaphelenchus xylophilus]